MSDDWRERNDAVAESLKHTGKREGAKYRIVCPFCTSSKTGRADYSMGVQAASGLYYCHRCTAGGKLQEAPDPSAVGAEAEERVEIEPPEGYVPLGWEPGLSSIALDDARAYATKRGLDEAMCRTLQVGAVLDGYYGGRIVIPLLGDDNEWLGYVTRDYTGRAAKPYLYSVGMQRARFFNHDALSMDGDEPILVVEGILDAVPYWPDGVAMLGKLTHEQKDALCTTSRAVVAVFDGDAWIEAHALTMELRMRGQRAGWVKLPPKVDPDEVSREWLRGAARASLEEPL